MSTKRRKRTRSEIALVQLRRWIELQDAAIGYSRLRDLDPAAYARMKSCEELHKAALAYAAACRR